MILIKGTAFTVRYKTLGKNIIQITLSHLASCHCLSQLPIIKKKMNKLFPVHIPKHQIIMWMFVIGFLTIGPGVLLMHWIENMLILFSCSFRLLKPMPRDSFNDMQPPGSAIQNGAPHSECVLSKGKTLGIFINKIIHHVLLR